jgi:hypothetical protein
MTAAYDTRVEELTLEMLRPTPPPPDPVGPLLDRLLALVTAAVYDELAKGGNANA